MPRPCNTISERDFVPLMEVLATVNRHTGWMEEFQHWQQRHHHGRPADRVDVCHD